MKIATCLIILAMLTKGGLTANILVASGVFGSHFYSAVNTAEFLAQQGHNVTLFSCGKESRVDLTTGKKFHFFQPPEFVLYDTDDMDKMEELILAVSQGPSEDLLLDMMAANEHVIEYHMKEHKRITKAYDHPTVEDMLLNWGLDLIVLEQTVMQMLVTKLEVMKLKIPTVVVYSAFAMMDLRNGENMPGLLNSEHNMLNDVSDGKPDFYGRFGVLKRIFKFLRFVLRFQEISEEYSIPMETLMNRHEMNFGLGHPALAFPELAPPNFKYLGFFTMTDHVPKPLPKPMLSFIDGCGHRPIIYMSFGTFLPDPKSLPWIKDFFNYLLKTDICVIFKAYPDLTQTLYLPSERVYIQYWMPQKDILASKKVKFFLSHCGNNGRLEAIFFNVPILCLPLFAEQYQNSLLVKMKQFGSFFKKETIIEKGESFVVDTINDMLRNLERYKTNMAVAKATVLKDPGAGPNVFLYHVNHILDHGNARHLKNEILLQQSMVEIYNLDILGIFLLIVLIVIVLLGVVLVKCCKWCYRKAFGKQKTK